jgi:hypothetical protein
LTREDLETAIKVEETISWFARANRDIATENEADKRIKLLQQALDEEYYDG